MAFFGLTALGAQSPFSSTFVGGITVGIFELREFADAYDDVLDSRSAKGPSSAAAAGGGAAGLTLADIPAILQIVFHGPVPEGELRRCLSLFSAAGERPDGTALSKDLFLAGIEELQGKAEVESISPTRAAAAHYVSFDELKQHRMRHVPAGTGPAENFTMPMTANQEIGWRAHELPADKRYPKKHCEETKFMAILRSSGLI